MEALLVASIPISPTKTNRLTNTDSSYSLLSSVPEEYCTPQLSIRRRITSSESDTISSEQSLSNDSDYEDCTSTTAASKHVHFASSPKPKIHTQVSLVDDEAEFFAVVIPEDIPDSNKQEENQTSKAVRKRDKVRAIFKKTFPQSNSVAPDSNGEDWNEVLAKALTSMHRDIGEIIDGLDEVGRPATDDVPADTSERILVAPRLSFAERQRGKLQLMRMAQMLHPPTLLTCDVKESPYPYTDIISPPSVDLFRLRKSFPLENLLIQHRPFQHKKFRYRTQRCLLRLQRDLKKLKQDIYGGETLKSHKELPSLDVQNYRNRLEKTLLEVRTQIAEYDRVHSLVSHHRPSISQIITKLKEMDAATKARIEDYRTKLRPIEYIQKGVGRGLISAPFIPRRSRCRPVKTLTNTNNNELVDMRFDPTTFVDLVEEAQSFFKDAVPFWDRPADERSSISSLALSARRSSNRVFLPPEVGLWDRLVYAFKAKQKMLRDAELAESLNEHEDEFLTFASPSMSQKQIESSTVYSTDPNKDH